MTKTANLRYSTQVVIEVAGTGVISGQSFRANSCWDPDQTGIGHTCLGYNVWSKLYNHYIVEGSTISVRLSVLEGEIVPVQCILLSSTDNKTAFVRLQDMREYANSPTTIINQVEGNWKYLREWYSPYKMWNIQQPDVWAKLECGLGSSLVPGSGIPTEQWFWILGLSRIVPEGELTTKILAMVEINYRTKWYDPMYKGAFTQHSDLMDYWEPTVEEWPYLYPEEDEDAEDNPPDNDNIFSDQWPLEYTTP